MYLEGIPSAGGRLVSLIWVMIVEESFSYSPPGARVAAERVQRADGKGYYDECAAQGILLALTPFYSASVSRKGGRREIESYSLGGKSRREREGKGCDSLYGRDTGCQEQKLGMEYRDLRINKMMVEKWKSQKVQIPIADDVSRSRIYQVSMTALKGSRGVEGGRSNTNLGIKRKEAR
jgi:hypothetical protein